MATWVNHPGFDGEPDVAPVLWSRDAGSFLVKKCLTDSQSLSEILNRRSRGPPKRETYFPTRREVGADDDTSTAHDEASLCQVGVFGRVERGRGCRPGV